jgi:hypothetical protein
MAERRRHKPAITDESRESQLVSDAMDHADKQIREGTASSQVLTHFLKLGSSRERLEQEKLRRENELLQSKVEAMASAKRVEELYAAALQAMRSYAGEETEATDAEFDDYDD